MWQWIQRSKETLSTIIDQVVRENTNLQVRVAFVGYRDIGEHNRFSVMNFTKQVEMVQHFISKQEAEGGGDAAEDVQGAFNQALNLDWSPQSAKQIFHICDAPGHGKDICEYRVLDFYREGGSPEGFKLQEQMERFAAQNIQFTFFKLTDKTDLMQKVMQKHFNLKNSQMELAIADMEESVRTKSIQAVDAEFIKAASFMLSATVQKKKKQSARQKEAEEAKVLWSGDQLATDQYLSQTAYVQVQEIEGNRVTVVNQYGKKMFYSRDILENMWSADHYEREVPMQMTALSELLHNVSDHIFTV